MQYSRYMRRKNRMGNTEAEVFALSSIIPNYTTRQAYWCTVDFSELQPYYEELSQNPNYNIIRAIRDDEGSDGAVIEVGVNYFCKALIDYSPELLREYDLTEFKRENAIKRVSFEDFLLENCAVGYDNIIALYNLNAKDVIAYRGINYPCFGVSLMDALPMLSEYGFKVRVAQNYVTPAEFLNIYENRDRTKSFIPLRISPNGKGVFIKIQSTFNQQQVENAKNIYRQKFQVK